MRGLAEISSLSRRALQRSLQELGTPLPVEVEDVRDMNVLLQHLGHVDKVVDSRGWLTLDARTLGCDGSQLKVDLDDYAQVLGLAAAARALVERYTSIGLGMATRNEDGHTTYFDIYLPSPNHHN